MSCEEYFQFFSNFASEFITRQEITKIHAYHKAGKVREVVTLTGDYISGLIKMYIRSHPPVSQSPLPSMYSNKIFNTAI